jgi:aminopeptidase N
MKRLITVLIFCIITLFTYTQTQDTFNVPECSHAKFFSYFLKNSKDIIQTPLLNDYDVKFYFLDLNVENNTIYISGKVTFYAEVVAATMDTFAFELLDEMTIDQVEVNALNEPFSQVSDEVFVPLSNAFVSGEIITCKITYHGTPPTGGFFSGVSTGTGWDKNVTWTLAEPFAARDWWPTKQVLQDKADSVWIFLTTSDENMAGSNGVLTNVTPMPDNKLRYEWKSNYPIDYYLISFAVSEYQDYQIYAHPAEMGNDSLLIQNFIYDSPGCLENYQDGIDQTAEFIELYSDLFSLYPFHEEKYGHCLTPLGGGMEHQTMTTLGGFSFGLVAHELGHMWFGDNVTCATWSDIWVNEGFATYTDYLANEFILGQAAADAKMNSIHNSVMSQPGGSVYVPPAEVTYDNIWRIFDGRLSYNKGAAILHMIRFELQNDEMFFQVLKNYQEQFADSTATGLDFMNVLNGTSGQDFTQFFNQWYFGEGYPTYSIVWSQNQTGTYMEVSQSVSEPSITPLFEMLMAYKFSFNDGTDTTVCLNQTANLNSFALPVTKEITSLQVDPDNWVLNHVGSITVGLDTDESINSFTFLPNPANNKLNLSFSSNNQLTRSIKILDLNGKVRIFHTSDLNRFALDISGLSAGSYILQIEEANATFSKKFIKQD